MRGMLLFSYTQTAPEALAACVSR